MNISIIFPDERIKDLLIGALEGGSNYWIDPGFFSHHSNSLIEFYDNIMLEKDYFVIKDNDGYLKGLKEVNLNSLKHAILLMSEKYPRHFSDAITENDDACTADVFLQLAVFGEVIFG